MPLYEYKCHSCGEKFEVIQKFSDAPLKTHPNCGGEVERLISTSALKFKGSGWYVTDYASSGNGGKDSEKKESDKKEAAKESKTDKQPASDSTGKTDFKPASTTSSKPEKKS